ncbi:hypothetical protein AMATHDRAFT_88223 [Amanita thiersii Skay4041]|uniref:Fungal-type protein kinase domain-containing protein n=1 Tax=Amanita thiersii Skay4041 TaxID=703135 RepID=A0A2A9NFZ0_9AGAR|nr:hypothetical protein AMATHDRAFT_88223 [Amanita thiersii Skay4041]
MALVVFIEQRNGKKELHHHDEIEGNLNLVVYCLKKKTYDYPAVVGGYWDCTSSRAGKLAAITLLAQDLPIEDWIVKPVFILIPTTPLCQITSKEKHITGDHINILLSSWRTWMFNFIHFRTREICFAKDFIYEQLRSKPKNLVCRTWPETYIEHVPTSGINKNSNTSSDQEPENHPRKFLHHRCISNTIWRSLTHFKNIKEYVTAIRDAIKGHRGTHSEAGTSHHDISVANIVITEKGRGILIDWDALEESDDSEGSAQYKKRMGTWQFMAHCLSPTYRNNESEAPTATYVDGLESFYYVLYWVALRYTAHGLGPECLHDELHSMFDYVRLKYYYPAPKADHLLENRPIHSIRFKSMLLSSLLRQVHSVLRTRYIDGDTNSELANSPSPSDLRDNSKAANNAETGSNHRQEHQLENPNQPPNSKFEQYRKWLDDDNPDLQWLLKLFNKALATKEWNKCGNRVMNTYYPRYIHMRW